MAKRFSELIFGLLSAPRTAPGHSNSDRGDPIAARLEKARRIYEQEIEKSKTLITRALDQAEAMARNAADVDLVRLIKAERAEYEATGKPPKRARLEECVKQREAIRKAMFDAYTFAIRDYLKARKDDEAEQVKEERDKFQRDKPGDGLAHFDAIPQSGTALPRFIVSGDLINGARAKADEPEILPALHSNPDLDLHHRAWWEGDLLERQLAEEEKKTGRG